LPWAITCHPVGVEVNHTELTFESEQRSHASPDGGRFPRYPHRLAADGYHTELTFESEQTLTRIAGWWMFSSRPSPKNPPLLRSKLRLSSKTTLDSSPKELYLLRSKTIINGESMNPLPTQFEHMLEPLLAELGDFQVSSVASGSGVQGGVRVAGPYGLDFSIEVKEFKRITPASAESACLTVKRQAEATGSQPVLFASVVSDRTAEIATKHGVSWMDYAGNCRLVFPSYGIYVNRRGIENQFGKQLPKVLNVFSAKSSRVVRAMLQEPLREWQLNELASHPNVRVSPGLMSRIKQTLVEGGYAVMHKRQLRLKQAARIRFLHAR